MEVKAYLYPNAPFEGPTLTDIWGEAYVMRNRPFLELVFCGLHPGRYVVDLLVPIRLQQPFRASDQGASTFLVHPNLQNPDISQVSIRLSADDKTIEEATCPVSVHKVTGQVKDFGGRPLSAYVWAVEQPCAERPQAMGKTDPEGRFTLWYPEGRRMRLFIDDESYSRTTYEF